MLTGIVRKPTDKLYLLQVLPKTAGGIMMPVDAPMDVSQVNFDNIVTSSASGGSDSCYTDELRESYGGILQEHKIATNEFEFVHVVDSNPGSAICRWAKSNKMQHIVIGTRGLSKLKRTLLGSVSDYVIHNSNTPVSIVPNTN